MGIESHNLWPDIELLVSEVERTMKELELELEEIVKGRGLYVDEVGGKVEILEVKRGDKFIGINQATGCISGFDKFGGSDNSLTPNLTEQIIVKNPAYVVVWDQSDSNQLSVRATTNKQKMIDLVSYLKAKEFRVLLVKELNQEFCDKTPSDVVLPHP